MATGDEATPAAGTATAAAAAKTPADFLKSIRGRPVVVKLSSGADFRGVLACLDGYMNIAMEQTEVRPAARRAGRGHRSTALRICATARTRAGPRAPPRRDGLTMTVPRAARARPRRGRRST